ncbi:hypothetical protein TH9_12375 [Thalassospira xiamenensis]|uniref:hypothetical protein n=1 Tax=Thalassospira xiamenensis TaxID=220697 RepID=UPI000DEDA6E3|nr:hypothetical protein [Thalassospira xiamenensis]RCK32517.1 hypothetical protein TH9_12375 [Thalassospira xiamenensis]
MNKPSFDSQPIASVRLSEFSPPLAHIEGGSFRHQHKLNGSTQTIMTLSIGDIGIQCADPAWFRHLIDQANAALISAGYHPHTTPANDEQPGKDGKDAA